MGSNIKEIRIVFHKKKKKKKIAAAHIIIKLKPSLKQFYYMSYVNFSMEERAPSRIIYIKLLFESNDADRGHQITHKYTFK